MFAMEDAMRFLAQQIRTASTSVRRLKPIVLSLFIASVSLQPSAKAQGLRASPQAIAAAADEIAGAGGGGGRSVEPGRASLSRAAGPFSHFAFGGGVSPLGINLMAATDLNRHMNLRFSGNTFRYTVSGLSTNGFNVGAVLNLASAGVSADIYPFPNHGLRLSPGVLVYNGNAAAATFTAQGGESFTLNGTTYYSSSTNPVTGLGTLGLNSQKPAFTLTTGWGNALRRNGHISFPFEIGAAFIGAPSLNIVLNSGQVCDAQGNNCVDVATDPTVQSNLQQQIAKYRSDLSALRTFPIVSFGVAYSFGVR
jgi:hypothetical protein